MKTAEAMPAEKETAKPQQPGHVATRLPNAETRATIESVENGEGLDSAETVAEMFERLNAEEE